MFPLQFHEPVRPDVQGLELTLLFYTDDHVLGVGVAHGYDHDSDQDRHRGERGTDAWRQST